MHRISLSHLFPHSLYHSLWLTYWLSHSQTFPTIDYRIRRQGKQIFFSHLYGFRNHVFGLFSHSRLSFHCDERMAVIMMDRPVISLVLSVGYKKNSFHPLIIFYLRLKFLPTSVFVWKKVGIQRRKNVNNDARMKGKCPKILRNNESYEFLFLGVIFLSFMRRYSRFCVVGYRLFFQVWYIYRRLE